MCTEYSAKKEQAEMTLEEKVFVFGIVPHEKIRPTDLGPVILPEEDSFVCREMRWGWGVPWDPSPLVNAKSETLTTLKTFQPHLANRCLLLADGFIEKGVRFRQPDGRWFCFAGLWRKEAGVRKYTMLTTTPNETVAKYHHRMPFILKPEQFDAWLGDGWQDVLAKPDRAPLEKFQKQPELF
jgi:putative SOS response-associated peptidase YedK